MAGDVQRYDVIVAGIGGMGSATAYHLARRGRRVLGLERFTIPHEMGSSHGLSRMIRLAYYENPAYVILARRAYELWRELQAAAGEQLLYITGNLDCGEPGSEVLEGAQLACRLHDLPHEILDAAEIRARFPAFRLPETMSGVLQPDGGFLVPERCIEAHTRLAEAAGAEIHREEPVLTWEPRGGGVRVSTARGVYEAARLVIAAGAWAGQLVERLAPVTSPERQVLAWFQPLRPERFALGSFPAFIIDTGAGICYGFPLHGDAGFKIALHHHLGQPADPDTLDRTANAEDEQVLRTLVTRYFPDAAGPTLLTKVCMYTNTPDRHFILDRHPDHPQVALAAGFSGHGFKFCSVVGEIMADLTERGQTAHDISMFRLARLLMNSNA